MFGKRPGVVGSSSGGDVQGGSDGVLTSRARVFDGDISKLTNLGKAIQVAERALVQNAYHNKVYSAQGNCSCPRIQNSMKHREVYGLPV